VSSSLVVAVLAAARPASAKVITGTPENDVLRGTGTADRIRGLTGDDDITGGRGDDWLFGDEGDDTFRWRNGDGRDRVDGGPGGFDTLLVDAGKRLRLHLDALGAGAGPEAAAGNGPQVIGVKDVEQVSIVGTRGADRLVLSSDRGIPGPGDANGTGLFVDTGAGDDVIDVRGARVAKAGPDEFFSAVFSAVIHAGDGDDTIRTDGGSWTVFGQAGENEIRLGRARNFLYYEEGAGEGGAQHDTVFGFGEDDFVVSTDFIFDGSGLDTNGDRRLDARDRTVTVRNGSMTIDLSSGTFGVPPGTVTLTLVGRVRLSLRQILDNSD
jgi:Ca2+-binding RTX toxin-like protein